MSRINSGMADSGQEHHGPARSESQESNSTHDDEKQDSTWTVVDVVEPQDSTDDDDRSLVEISRISSPVLVQLSGLDIADRPQLHIPWPSNLPWFQFQDRFFNNVAARAMFAAQIKVNPSTRSHQESAMTSLVALPQQQSLTTQAGFNRAVSKVNNLMPEQFDGENAGRVKNLVGGDPLEAKIQEFQLFAYQLSNNLIEDEDDEYIEEDGKYTKIIEIFREIGLPRSVWKDLIIKSLEQPTGRAFAEALFAAAVNTQALDICEVLLEAGADPDNIIWTWAMGKLARPVQLAVDSRVRSVDLLKLLIRFGADVDLVTEEERDTALLTAARECSYEAVKVLVEAEANIMERLWTPNSLTADTVLTNAVEADWRMSHIRDEAEKDELEKSGKPLAGLQRLKYLLTLYDRERDHDMIQDGLLRAAAGDRCDMIMDLVQAGADVSKASSSGHIPLIAAATRSYKGSGARMIKMLLDLGADVHGTRLEGICAIHIAAAKGDEKVIEVLIDQGADVNACTDRHTIRGRSLLGSRYQCHGVAADTLKELEACRTPLQFALFRNKAEESRYNPKSGRAALALIRAGAILEGGDLARAACFNDIDLLQEVLSQRADVNELNRAGRSALQTCLEFGNVNLAEYLLDSGAVVRKGDLLSAVKTGRRDIVDMLFNHGAVIEDLNSEISILEGAASSKNWELMVWLMEAHNIPYNEGALCTAICSGLGSSIENERYLLSLLKKRAKNMTGGILEATALGYAAFHRQRWVLSNLLKLDINGPCVIPLHNDSGYLHLYQVHCGTMSFAYEKPFWADPTMIRCSVLVPALFTRDWHIVSQMLRAGHRPDRLSLLVAIEGQSLAAITRITRRMKKPDVHKPARSNLKAILETPLQAAVRHRRVDIARYLISIGADVNAPAPDRLTIYNDWDEPLLPRTALQAAVENGHMEMIELLLDNGADVNNPPGEDAGATALQIAAAKGLIGVARRLLGLGADVNAKGAVWDGRSALEAAAEAGRLDMVQFLLEQGATVDYSRRGDFQYEMAVELAEQKGHDAIVQVLEAWRSEIVWEGQKSESEESSYIDESEDGCEDDSENSDDEDDIASP